MKILLVAATEFEIRPLLSQMALKEKKKGVLTTYIFRTTPVDVLITGVGMTHTAYYMGRYLSIGGYDVAINAGIAGAYETNIRIGTVVNVVTDCISELGAEDDDRFLTFFDLGLMDPEAPPYKSGHLVNDHVPDLPSVNKLPRVSGNTVNHIHAVAESIAAMRALYPAEVESMEGAAFLYACLSEEIRCLQVRSISNYVLERDKSRWNVPLALKNLNQTIEHILKETCN